MRNLLKIIKSKCSRLIIFIREFYKYGKQLVTSPGSKDDGKKIIDLAHQLKQLGLTFLLSQQTLGIQEQQELKKNFMQLLERNYQSMGNHRAFWKPLLANIVIAATGIGLIALGIHYSLNRSFFFSTTHRQNQLHQIKDQMESLNNSEVCR